MFPISDPILVFTILALVMLAAPLLAERLRVPDLVLLLAAGAVLGPNGLGVLARNSAVTMFGAVGLLYIMFLAGIEIDLQRFARCRGRSISFGLITFIIPQTLGILAGRYLLRLDWPASILLASMFASHTLLAYPIASRLGISRSEPVAVTVGATIITDTLALLVLAVIADSARGVALGPGFWAGIAAGMTALVFLTWWGIPILARWFFQSVTEKGGAQFLFVIVTTCGCAYLSHFARLEPIIGAFLAGAAFNRLIPENSPLMNRVVFAGNTLFIPFFLISVGMLVDPRALATDPRNWLVGATMVIMVIATKYAAAQLARRLFGYSAAAGSVMFGLSVVQAAATLAAVLVGYQLKIFDESVLNGAIAMILVTCPLGAWVVERAGRTLAATELAAADLVRCDQRLLVAVAKHEASTRLLDLAFLLRHKTIPGGIYPLTIVRDQEEADRAVAQGENLLAHCMACAAAADIQINPALRLAVNVSDGILNAARELRATTVLAGWGPEHTASARIFGSVRYNLIETCPARLIFCRLTQPLNTTRRLLLPVSPMAAQTDLTATLSETKALAQQIGAELVVYLTGQSGAQLGSQIEQARPHCRMARIESGVWSETRARLLKDIRPDDMMWLPAERRGDRLWAPTLERLPGLIASRFPQLNLLVVYPPLPAARAEELPAEPLATEPALPLMLAVDHPAGTPLEPALRLMVQSAWPNDGPLVKIAFDLLLESARFYPVELTGGVALLHAHCEAVDHSRLLIGYCPTGWPLTNMSSPPRIILALLSSRHRPPELHLKALGELARRFHDKTTAEAIRTATSAETVQAILDESR